MPLSDGDKTKYMNVFTYFDVAYQRETFLLLYNIPYRMGKTVINSANCRCKLCQTTQATVIRSI